MSEQLILDMPAFLGWSFLCLVNGAFLGLAAYAFTCEVLKQAGVKPIDWDGNQAKADELFAPVRSYRRDEMMAYLKARAGK